MERVPRKRAETGASIVEHTRNGERALTVGTLGRDVEAALENMRAAGLSGDAALRSAALYACVRAVWRYFVQRDMSGHIPAQDNGEREVAHPRGTLQLRPRSVAEA